MTKTRLDESYAKYDDLSEAGSEPEGLSVSLSEDDFRGKLSAAKNFLLAMEATNGCISEYAKAMANLYTLWSVVVLEKDRLSEPPVVAQHYSEFMRRVVHLSTIDDLDEFLKSSDGQEYQAPLSYWTNVRGANTDLAPRQARYNALLPVVAQK